MASSSIQQWRWVLSDTWHRLDWRSETLGVTLIIAESAILYLYLGILLPTLSAPYAPFPAWLIILLMMTAYYLPYMLDILRVWGSRYEATLAAGIALSLLLSLKVAAYPAETWFAMSWLQDTMSALIVRPNEAVRPVWSIVALLAYVWWRGRSRAEPALETAYMMLRWGTLAVTIGLVLALIATPAEALIRDRMVPAVVIFFAASLTGISIARLRLEGVRTGAPLGPRWLIMFAVPIAGIILTAILATGMFSQRFLSFLLLVLTPAFWVTGLILRVIIVIIAMLAFAFIAPVIWFLKRQGIGPFSGSGQFPSLLTSLERAGEFTRSTLDVADPMRYLIASIVLFLITSLLVRYVYRRRRSWVDTVSETHDTVPVSSWPFSGIPVRLRHFFSRQPDPLDHLRGDRRWRHTVAIREIFIYLQAWGAQTAKARASNMTPDEYGRVLIYQYPDLDQAIQTITSVYDAARYGGSPASAQQAEAARQAWSIVQRHRKRSSI